MIFFEFFFSFQVNHPIHDQTFYLSTEHKTKLKAEFGKLSNNVTLFQSGLGYLLLTDYMFL